jgi:hypothetical protein
MIKFVLGICLVMALWALAEWLNALERRHHYRSYV